MANADLLAAVNAAIEDPSTVTPLETPDDDEVQTPVGEGADPSGSDDAAGELDDPLDEEADGDDAEGEQDDADEVDPVTGEKKPIAAVVKTPEEIAADAVKAAAAAKPKDHINDPVDERLKESTKERITGLITIAKDLTARYEDTQQNLNAVMAPILESKANDAQFTQAMQYIGAVNSGDPVMQEKAWEFMLGEMQALGRMLGKEVPGMDYLAGHPDLKQAVAAGQVTQEVAKELAIKRDQSAHTTRVQQQQRQHQTTTDQQNALITEGRNALNALGVQLKGSDPQYEQKRAILTASLKGAFANIDPRQWAPRYKAAYDALKIAAPAKTAVVAGKKSNVPNNQPLRGKQPAGGAVAAPKSAREAIENALSNM